jgi:hypothetical protein
MRIARDFVIMAAKDAFDASRFEIAVKSRRQPEGQQHERDKTADAIHVINKRCTLRNVNLPRHSLNAGVVEASYRFDFLHASHSREAGVSLPVQESKG